MDEISYADQQLVRLQQYIQQNWRELRRSNRTLLQAAKDPKFPRSNGEWLVYVSPKEDVRAVENRLREQMDVRDFRQIKVLPLPGNGTALREPGLLYVPYPYVVPGGRYNELYGWDGFFIVLGLLRQGEVELAKQMTDNYLYEIEHYGAILNANRSYYLTRSQPPFLTGMLLRVFEHTRDRTWLRRTVPAIEKYYRYWTEEPYFIAKTGLSRYYDRGTGPAPEAVSSEIDEQGRNHYERVRDYYRITYCNPEHSYGYDVRRFYDVTSNRLTSLFYTGDRSMRESGFDPSNRFGTFGIGVIDYNPVCLNTLLYVMECETAEIYTMLCEWQAAAEWRKRAATRADRINKLLWDEEAGLYLDYNYEKEARRNYLFATTFWPLWAGLASEEQARRVVDYLPRLEAPGGLQTSETITGCQWDAPYGWAPLQLLAVEGLRRYGYEREANRISINFLSLVLQEFVKHDAVFEKYDVVQRTSGTALEFGYISNEIGFGWTNGTVLELLASLPRLPLAGV